MKKQNKELEDKLRQSEQSLELTKSGSLTKSDVERMKAEVHAHFEHVPQVGDEDAQNDLFNDRFKSLGQSLDKICADKQQFSLHFQLRTN